MKLTQSLGIYHPKTFALGIVLLLVGAGCAMCFYNVTQIQDPIPYYSSYVSVERDGYTKVIFRYSIDIDVSMTKITILNEDIEREKQLNLKYPYAGFYYFYSIVYDNGTILDSEKEYISYGKSRLLVDFPTIQLTIKQNQTSVVENPERMREEINDILMFSVGGIIMFLFSILFLGMSRDRSINW